LDFDYPAQKQFEPGFNEAGLPGKEASLASAGTTELYPEANPVHRLLFVLD
jgi:hypothetical protein